MFSDEPHLDGITIMMVFYKHKEFALKGMGFWGHPVTALIYSGKYIPIVYVELLVLSV